MRGSGEEGEEGEGGGMGWNKNFQEKAVRMGRHIEWVFWSQGREA